MAYRNLQFIGYMVNTAADAQTKKYSGYDKAEEDIANRRMLMLAAIETAEKFASKNPGCLKIFMAPEFYFRGTKGAYEFTQMSELLDSLRSMVHSQKYKDWLFIFGSILGYSVSDTSDKLEVYNIVLVQKGNCGPEGAHVILKEHLSDVDFLSRGKKKTGSKIGKIKYEDVVHLAPSKSGGKGREKQKSSYDGRSLFRTEGITFGLEVCKDHSQRRLWKSPPRKKEDRVQIQLIPSCGMEIVPSAVVVPPGGLVFNVDADAINLVTIENQIDRNGYLNRVPLMHYDRGGIEETKGSLKNAYQIGTNLTSIHNKCFKSRDAHLLIGEVIATPRQVVTSSKNPHWVPDSAASKCCVYADGRCGSTFSFKHRKHHCRYCGRVCCSTHTQKRMRLPGYPYDNSPVRVCDECVELINRLQKNNEQI